MRIEFSKENEVLVLKVPNGTVELQLNSDGELHINTYQRNGSRRYFLDENILDGKLNEIVH